MTYRLGTTDGPGGGWRLGTNDRQAYASGAASITSVTGSAADVIRAGESFTIAGTNFEVLQLTGTVTVGGVAVASYTSWSDTEIVAVAPAEGLMFTGAKTVIVNPPTNDPGQRGGVSYFPPTGWVFKRLTTTTIPSDSLVAGVSGLAVGDEVFTESTWTRVGEAETATWNFNTVGDGTGYLTGYTTDGDYAADVEIRDATDGTDTTNGPATVTVDTTAPAGYGVNWDQGSITSANQTAASFTFVAAEVDTEWDYTISSSGGGTPLTDTGTIATSTDQITSIDVSSLPNGNLTLAVRLTDAAGNRGEAASDLIAKGSLAFSDGPSVLSLGSTSVRLQFTAVGSASIDYAVVIVANGAGTPDPADVLAGTVAGDIAILIDRTAQSGVQEDTSTLAGLTPETAYDVYMAIDDGFSDPLLSQKIDITTNAATVGGSDIVTNVVDDIVVDAVKDIAA